jgi:hypothetical protein
MDSLFSFPVGLFHPLQHAGLSRRTTIRRRSVQSSYWRTQARLSVLIHKAATYTVRALCVLGAESFALGRVCHRYTTKVRSSNT